MSTFQPQQPQLQNQPQQQQPVVVYPNPVTKQPPGSSHHSNGSFGTVFIILAVIAVVSAIACLLGRLCNRRAHSQKPKAQTSHKPSRSTRKDRQDHHVEFGSDSGQHNNFRPRDQGDVEFGNNPNINSRPNKEGGDIEFGFDNKRGVPNGNNIKTNGNREGRGHVVFDNITGAVKHHAGDHHDHGGPRANPE